MHRALAKSAPRSSAAMARHTPSATCAVALVALERLRARAEEVRWTRPGVAAAIVARAPSAPRVMEAPCAAGSLRDSAETTRAAVASRLDALSTDVRRAIRARVNGAVVTLEGEVPTVWERFAAEDSVTGIRGVRRIVNHVRTTGRYLVRSENSAPRGKARRKQARSDALQRIPTRPRRKE